MALVIAHRVAGFVFHRLGPLLWLRRVQFRIGLRAADRMPAWQHASEGIIWRDLGITPDFETGTGNGERAASSVKKQPAHALAAAAGGALAEFAHPGEPPR